MYLQGTNMHPLGGKNVQKWTLWTGSASDNFCTYFSESVYILCVQKAFCITFSFISSHRILIFSELGGGPIYHDFLNNKKCIIQYTTLLAY